MDTTTLERLRLVALIEGASFLLLLLVAMPLKYLAGIPLAVKVVGWAHGMLFIAFCFLLAQTMAALGWPLQKAARVFAAGLIPFGTFLIDPALKREQQQLKAAKG